MALVAPFRALRFNPGKVDRLEDVVTPPYDIIDEKNQAAFQARNPYNMIYLDISKSPGKGDDSAERYNSAREYFTRWQQEDVLIRDAEPAIYLYYIDYILPSGGHLTRKGLVSLVGLEGKPDVNGSFFEFRKLVGTVRDFFEAAGKAKGTQDQNSSKEPG